MKKALLKILASIILLTMTAGVCFANAEESTIDRDALVGVWTFPVELYQDDTGLLVLNEDGTGQLGMIDFAFDLQWELEGDILTLDIPGMNAVEQQVMMEGDCLTLTEESGVVTEYTRVNGLPETEQEEPSPEAEFFLGEWDMYSPYGVLMLRIVYNRDRTAEIHIDLDGSDLVLRIRWNYTDRFLYFPTNSIVSFMLGTSDGWMQVAIEGERIVLIDDIILDDPGVSIDSRYVYVLTRPDNPLTEEEYQALQEKYALPEEENTEAE
ncbi:MAG: hypothetical protein IK127_00015 [Clostridia bacterium]|nr:hypothetical protein [Clostridia bacterium]